MKVCIVLQVVTNQFHGMHSFENLVLDQHNLISLSILITFVLDNDGYYKEKLHVNHYYWFENMSFQVQSKACLKTKWQKYKAENVG